jgi:C4-type Zn-finger protein
MDQVMAQSCPLCLQTDELPSMVPIEIPHALIDTQKHPILCRSCAFAVADAVDGLERTPAPEAQSDVRNPDSRD